MEDPRLDNPLEEELLELFRLRMAQQGEEGEALDRMSSVLRSTLEQIGLCSRLFRNPPPPLAGTPAKRLEALPPGARVGCQGVPGAFSQTACEELFERPDIRFYQEFEDVFAAVEGGEVAFGVLPVENSSAGEVTQVLELVSRHRFFIVASRSIAPRYCLCVHPDTDPGAVQAVISHPQGLMQCQDYLRSKGLRPERFSNTAAAAKKVGEGGEPLACLCNRRSAELYGLRILEEEVQDHSENYTRFLCISREGLALPGADTVSITLEFPNEPGYLGRLLTRFAVCNLNLCKIMSMPIASRDFNVRFYLDFKGAAEDSRVASLLAGLSQEFANFRYLGNYVGEYGAAGDGRERML